MKKKIECRMFNDNAELWDFIKLVGKVGTKFKIDSEQEMRVCDQILAIAKEARAKGRNPDSKQNLERIIPILREELSEYLDFKVYDPSTDGWVTEGA
jgi:hypothetical protein